MLTEERIPNSFRAQVRYRHRFYQLPPKRFRRALMKVGPELTAP